MQAGDQLKTKARLSSLPMSRVCILTDSTAQFPHPDFPGQELVNVVPLRLNLGGTLYPDARAVKLNQLHPGADESLSLKVLPPSKESFREILSSLARSYTDIIVLLLSNELVPVVAQAQTVLNSTSIPARVVVLNTHTTSAGLGLLVETAATAARNGEPAGEILRTLRVLIPHIYTLFCVQNLSYLAQAGKLDPAQAVVGEMLGLLPFLTLENGRLTPLQKARNTRHLIDYLLEFLAEFSHLKHVALIQGLPMLTSESRIVRERIQEFIPGIPFTEHVLGDGLAALLGPRSLSLVVMERS